jgi:hypothetical protein
MIDTKPVINIQLEPIEVAIRRERNRVFDVEFETGTMPSTWLIEYMVSERGRGITEWPINL